MPDFELLPDPDRIVNGLRDTGYNFNTAIADIVDNSIAANATQVFVRVDVDPSLHVSICVADNGIGMDLDGLKNAMKYGSKERENKSSLGKFGLGLKTASTAFCRQLSVISKKTREDKLQKVQWDLDHICEKNSWALKILEVDSDEIDFFDSVAIDGHGTLVVWDKVDRLLKEYKSDSTAKRALQKKITDLKFHLSMVFQRFLDEKDSRASNVEIYVNDEKLEPWDPFCTQEEKSENVQTQNVPIEVDGRKAGSFKIAAHIIPRKSEFSSKEASDRARGNNDYQGFYVYRENRLIHYGDWLGFFTKEPHYSLLRVDFSFTHELDEFLNVDIKKSRILLISEIETFLMEFLAAPRREALKRYRDGETNRISISGKDAHAPANSNIDAKGSSVESSNITPTGNENEALIKNNRGEFTKSITIVNEVDPKQNRVIPVNDIESGVLWEPALVNGKHAVNINQSHPFYKKIYGPILTKSVVVEGLDVLLWSLAEAENSTCNEESIENYEDMRFTVSRILKKLVADLPDPEIDEDEK